MRSIKYQLIYLFLIVRIGVEVMMKRIQIRDEIELWIKLIEMQLQLVPIG